MTLKLTGGYRVQESTQVTESGYSGLSNIHFTIRILDARVLDSLCQSSLSIRFPADLEQLDAAVSRWKASLSTPGLDFEVDVSRIRNSTASRLKNEKFPTPGSYLGLGSRSESCTR